MWAIRYAAEHGRRAWHLGGGIDWRVLVVPHPSRMVLDESTRAWSEDFAWRTTGTALIGERVMLALETATMRGRPAYRVARAALTKQDCSTYRALVAATCEDLLGIPRLIIADAFKWNRHTGAVGKRVRRGRALLAALGAWPWAYLPAAHDPPVGWQEDETIVAAWQSWRSSASM